MLEAELERDSAEDEREQHYEYGKIDRRNDDGEGEGESREQTKPAEHQPGLVAVPDRRDRIHEEDPLLSEPVTQSAGDQGHGRERQEFGVHHPLQVERRQAHDGSLLPIGRLIRVEVDHSFSLLHTSSC